MEMQVKQYKAKVTNLSDRPYEEKFKGDIIRFAPHETKIFDDWTDAVQFRGQFIPVKKNDTGTYINEKRIKIEKVLESETILGTKFVNPLNGKSFSTKEEFLADLKIEAQKGGRTAVESEGSEEVSELKAEVAELKALVKALAKPGSRTRKKKVEHDTDTDNGPRS